MEKDYGSWFQHQHSDWKLPDLIYPSEYLVSDQYNNIDGDDLVSDMREDTEELNVLLYSDYESDYSDDDEEASTGHSPSTMTIYDKPERSEETGEEVASSAVPSKRQKLSDGVYDVPLFENTTKLIKLHNFFENEDAESSCGNVNSNLLKEELSSLYIKKWARKDKIHETVNILRNIIPSGKGKDAIGVLDDAIYYLKSTSSPQVLRLKLLDLMFFELQYSSGTSYVQ